MKLYNKLFGLIILIMMGGCTFYPKNEYVSPILPPEPLSLYIDVNDPDFKDPYYLISTGYFNFTLKDLSNPVIDYEVKIDGIDLHPSFANNTLSFIIFPHIVPEGTHQVNITIVIATQSGSLAEKVGAEYYVIEESFTIITDRTPPPPVPVTTAMENGYLTMKWEAPKQNNFYYRVNKHFSSRYSGFYSVFNINDPKQNFYLDSGFVGGTVNYELFATGFGFDVKLGEVNFDLNPIDFAVICYDQDVTHITWNETKINTQGVQLYIGSTYNNKTQSLTETGNIPMDTVVLGDEIDYNIQIVRENFYNHKFYLRTTYKSEKNIKEFINQAILPIQNKLLILTPENIYRYSLPDYSIEDSISIIDLGIGNFYDMTVSEDESTALVVGGVPANLIRFDPLNFNSFSTIDIHSSNTVGGNTQVRYFELGNLSNNGLLAATLTRGMDFAVVYDIIIDSVIWGKGAFANIPPVISTDGNYIAVDLDNVGSVWQKSGEGFIRTGLVDTGLKHFDSTKGELINVTRINPNSNLNNITPTISFYNYKAPPNSSFDFFSKLREEEVETFNSHGKLTEIDYDDFTQMLITRYVDNANQYSVLQLSDINSFQQTISLKSKQSKWKQHIFSTGYHLNNRGYIELVK